jgi:DNA-binding LacI/PurR family transcriptional regulator
MEKRIAFFVGCVRTEYHYKITEEMERLAYEKGYKLEIFQNFELFNSNILFGYGEKNLAELPDLSQYDAIGLAPDTFLLSGYEEALLSKFKTISGIPIVSIRKEVDGLYNILLNDYNAIYGITEHCITHHGKRKIAFMK